MCCVVVVVVLCIYFFGFVVCCCLPFFLLLLKKKQSTLHGRARHSRVAKVCYPEGQRILLAGVLEHGEPERQ